MGHLLHFGAMDYRPELVTTLPVRRSGDTPIEVKPAFRHALSREQHIEMLLDDSDTRPIKTFYPENNNE